MHLSHKQSWTLACVLTATLVGGAVAFRGEAQRVPPASGAIVPAPQGGLSVADAVAELPRDVEVVLVIDQAATLRATPIGEAFSRVVTDSPTLAEIGTAWTSLANELGYGEDEAFDRLVGKRVIFVSRLAKGGDERVWAVLSDVSLDTERRLRERLHVAPRAIEQGHQILAVEKGAYELTTHVRGGGNGGDARGGAEAAPTVTLVLGPAGHNELFDELVHMLAQGAEVPIRTLNVAAQLRAVGPADVLLLAGLDELAEVDGDEPVPTRTPWKNFVILAGRRDAAVEGNGGAEGAVGAAGARNGCLCWNSRVIVRAPGSTLSFANVPLSSDAPFQAIKEHALCALVQCVPGEKLSHPLKGLPDPFSIFQFPDAARWLLKGRQALSVSVLPKHRLSFSFGMETTHPEALAGVMDPTIVRFVKTMEERLGAGQGQAAAASSGMSFSVNVNPGGSAGTAMQATMTSAPTHAEADSAAAISFDGFAPSAARVFPTRLAEPGTILSALFGSRPLVLGWAYPRARQTTVAVAPEALQPSSSSSNSGPATGWWVMNVSQSAPGDSPSASELVQSASTALLTPDTGGHMAHWVWMGSLRPSELESALPAGMPDVDGYRVTLQLLDRVELKLSITESSDLQGDLRVRFAGP